MRFPSARSFLRLCALSAALSVLAGAAMAQTTSNQPPRDKDRAAGPAAAAPAAAIVAQAPNSRLAALIRSGGTVIRNRGVASVSRIATGIYCILPLASTGINPANSIVTLTPEYFYSQLNEVKVQWAVSGSGCPSNRIAVYTLADVNADGIYAFSNLVGFSIVVP